MSSPQPDPSGQPDSALDNVRAKKALDAAGSLVRTLRREAGYSLATLATLADLSPGLLSQIERGLGNPSLVTIIKLAQALKVPAGRFFDGLDDTRNVVRRDSRPRLAVADQGLVYELMTPHLHGQIGVVRTELVPGFTNESAPFSHVGEECTMIIQGRVVITVDGFPYELDEGDSITYNSGLEHWYHNDSDEVAIVLGAMTPPSF
ncbi:XRE family transcriptional regulator [Actinokineospora sp. NBRC 105648]|uniref:helix-turn-helix domain-containing protein n=1 Tax=Actinokineospora sp. NBRC 105648 TaxID=3032206 RepID=UPI0024A59736|nr:XRE family transcriptional regulator [Actinokineospora sp. NBRC 105648]GLZ42288.1 transcriptional regulator [Actinokineospora sp. NBRC 105648]